MTFWQRLFTEHPASVDETYGQHFRNAVGFGFRMIWGGLVCLVHAIVPGVCCTKASEMVGELHDRMITHRRVRAESGQAQLQTRRAA